MSEWLKSLTDFVSEGTEAATEEKAEGATEAAKQNLNPIDAEKIVAPMEKSENEKTSLVPKATKMPKLKIPGSIVALLLLVLFMVFAIVPTKSGKTRLQLLWAVLYRGGMLRGQSEFNPHGKNPSNDKVEIDGSFFGADPNDLLELGTKRPVEGAPGMFYGSDGRIVDINGHPVMF